MVKAPARDPSDFCIAHSAEPALFMPEKAKRASTPKRILHMSCFAFFEVGLKGRVVGVRVSFDFNVSLDGCATGGPQPNWNRLALPFAPNPVHFADCTRFLRTTGLIVEIAGGGRTQGASLRTICLAGYPVQGVIAVTDSLCHSGIVWLGWGPPCWLRFHWRRTRT